jgi:hypothetical protein
MQTVFSEDGDHNMCCTDSKDITTCTDVYNPSMVGSTYEYGCFKDGRIMASAIPTDCWITEQFATKFNYNVNISQSMSDQDGSCICDLRPIYKYSYINEEGLSCTLMKTKIKYNIVDFNYTSLDPLGFYNADGKRENKDECIITCDALLQAISCEICPYTRIYDINNNMIYDNISNSTGGVLLLKMDNKYYEYSMRQIDINGREHIITMRYNEEKYCKDLTFAQNLLISNWFCMDTLHKVVIIFNIVSISVAFLLILKCILSCCHVKFNVDWHCPPKFKVYRDKTNNLDSNYINAEEGVGLIQVKTDEDDKVISNTISLHPDDVNVKQSMEEIDPKNELLKNMKSCDVGIECCIPDTIRGICSKLNCTRDEAQTYVARFQEIKGRLTNLDGTVRCHPTNPIMLETKNGDLLSDVYDLCVDNNRPTNEVDVEQGSISVRNGKTFNGLTNFVNYNFIRVMTFMGLLKKVLGFGGLYHGPSRELVYITLLVIILLCLIKKVKSQEDPCKTWIPGTTNGYSCNNNICTLKTALDIKLNNNNVTSCYEFLDDKGDLIYKLKLTVLQVDHYYKPQYIYNTNEWRPESAFCKEHHSCTIFASHCKPYAFCGAIPCSGDDSCHGWWPDHAESMVMNGEVCTGVVTDYCGGVSHDGRTGWCSIPMLVHAYERSQKDHDCSWRVVPGKEPIHVYELINHSVRVKLDIVEILQGTGEHYNKTYDLLPGSEITTKLADFKFFFTGFDDPLNKKYKLNHYTLSDEYYLSMSNEWNHIEGNLIGQYQFKIRDATYMETNSNQKLNTFFLWDTVTAWQNGDDCLTTYTKPKYRDVNDKLPGHYKEFITSYDVSNDYLILKEYRLINVEIHLETNGTFFVHSMSQDNHVTNFTLLCTQYIGGRLDLTYQYSCASDTSRALIKEVCNGVSRVIDYWTCDNNPHNVTTVLDVKHNKYYIENDQINFNCEEVYYGNFTQYEFIVNATTNQTDNWLENLFGDLKLDDFGLGIGDKIMNILWSIFSIIALIALIIGIIFVTIKCIKRMIRKRREKKIVEAAKDYYDEQHYEAPTEEDVQKSF